MPAFFAVLLCVKQSEKSSRATKMHNAAQKTVKNCTFQKAGRKSAVFNIFTEFYTLYSWFWVFDVENSVESVDKCDDFVIVFNNAHIMLHFVHNCLLNAAPKFGTILSIGGARAAAQKKYNICLIDFVLHNCLGKKKEGAAKDEALVLQNGI